MFNDRKDAGQQLAMALAGRVAEDAEKNEKNVFIIIDHPVYFIF